MGHAMPSGVTRFGVGLGFLDRNEAHTGFTSMAWIIGSQLKIAFVSRILKVKKKTEEWRILQHFLICSMFAEAWPHYQMRVCYS